jgi:hypothetical protein
MANLLKELSAQKGSSPTKREPINLLTQLKSKEAQEAMTHRAVLDPMRQISQPGAFMQNLHQAVANTLIRRPVRFVQEHVLDPASRETEKIFPFMRGGPRIPDVQLLSGAPSGGFAGGAGRLTGNVLSLLAPFGDIAEVTKGAQLIPRLGELAEEVTPKVMPLTQRLGVRLGGAGSIGAIENPDHPLFGAVEGVAAQVGGEALSPIASLLAPLARSPIGSAKKAFNTIIENVPGGLTGVRNIIGDRLNSISNELKGGSSGKTVRDDVFDTLQENHRAIKDDVNNRFNEVDQEAKRRGVVINLPETQKFIGNQINDLKPDLRLKKGDSLTKLNKLKTILQDKMAEASDVRDVRDAKSLREGINEDLRDQTLLDSVPRNKLKFLLPKITNSVDKELDIQFEKSGDSDLLDQWREANRKFAEKQKPYEVEPGGRPGKTKHTVFATLSSQDEPQLSKLFDEHIKPNVRKDETVKIKQLLKWLPNQEDKNKVAYDVVKNGDDNPGEWIKAYSKLGNNQKDLLFPHHRAELDDLQAVHKRFPSAFLEPKELGRAGKLFETFRVGGSLAAAPLTHGASLAIIGAPMIGRAMQSESLDKSLLKDLLSKIQPERTTGIERALMRSAAIRPRISAGILGSTLGDNK